MIRSSSQRSKVTRYPRGLANVEVLVATIADNVCRLPEQMNIHTDAVIAHQGNQSGEHALMENNYTIRFIYSQSRGVGRNRNIGLNAARGPLCLFSDDDVTLSDDYSEVICRIFECYPDADVVFFNLYDASNAQNVILRPHRVHWWNFLRYGTARVAVRLDSIRQAGIIFNQEFGGGTLHAHGEDTLFFAQCLKQRLKLLAVPDYIGTLTNKRPSTWQTGFNQKYVKDQGCLYRTMSPRWWYLWSAQDAIRRARKDYGMSPLAAFRLMLKR